MQRFILIKRNALGMTQRATSQSKIERTTAVVKQLGNQYK